MRLGDTRDALGELLVGARVEELRLEDRLALAVALAQQNDERATHARAAAGVAAVAMGVQYGLHRLPSSVCHVLHDGLWLLLVFASCACGAHAMEGACPSDG